MILSSWKNFIKGLIWPTRIFQTSIWIKMALDTKCTVETKSHWRKMCIWIHIINRVFTEWHIFPQRESKSKIIESTHGTFCLNRNEAFPLSTLKQHGKRAKNPEGTGNKCPFLLEFIIGRPSKSKWSKSIFKNWVVKYIANWFIKNGCMNSENVFVF